MNKSLLVILLLLWMLPTQGKPGTPLEVGNPYLKNFTTAEYKAHAQNFAVVRDHRGMMYFGNFAGVLQYDGNTWRLIATEKITKVSSLAVDRAGTIFVGARGEIGYLISNATGEMVFRSILPKKTTEIPVFQDVNYTYCTPNGILFISAHEVFTWQKNALKRWHSDQNILAGFYVNKRLFLQLKETGLVELKDGKIKPLAGGARLSGAIEVKAMFAFRNNEVLVTTATQGLYILNGNGLSPLDMHTEDLFRKSIITSGACLSNGAFAFGTTREGVVILSPDGKIIQRIDKKAGMITDYVHAVYADPFNHLWVALNNGLAMIEIPSQLTYFDERSGLNGSVTQIIRFQEQLVVSTYQGLYFYDEKIPEFKAAPIIITACWAMHPYGQELIVATTQGIFTVARQQPVLINEGFSLSLCSSHLDPEAVYVGQTEGLVRIVKSGGRWKVARIAGLTGEIRDLHEDAKGNIWGNTLTKGLFRYSPALQKLDHFGVNAGLPAANSNSINFIDGQILNATRDGIYIFDEVAFRFKPYYLLGQDSTGANPWFTSMIQEDDGNIWTTAADESELTLFEKNKLRYIKNQVPFLPVEKVVVWAIYPESNGITWFGGPDGMICFNPSIVLPNRNIPKVIIRQVAVHNDSVIYAGNIRSREDSLRMMNTVLPFRDNSLVFEYSVPYYSALGELEFQYKLEGFEESWSDWNTKTHKEYTNLPKGNYVFRVKAKNVYGSISTEATFNVRILSPWYSQWWAYLLYVLVTCGVMYLIVILRNRQLLREKRQLEQKIVQRTAEVVQQKEEIEHQSAELANKNDELEKINILVKSINSEIHFSNLLQSLLEKTKMIRSVEKATALILDKKTDTFRFKASFGWDIRLLEDVQLTLAQAEKRYLKNTEEIYEDIFLKKEFSSFSEDREMPDLEVPRSMLVLVIKVDHKVEAFLMLENMSRELAYEQHDLNFIRNSKEHIISAFIKTRILEDLQSTLQHLKDTQDQLVQSEKLASLGQLTAGIAHEIQNPLNFVNNFSSLSAELAVELKEALEAMKDSITTGQHDEFDELIGMIKGNVQKINEHGKRAESIVKGMLQHSRGKTGEYEQVEMNNLVTEYVNLAYHGMRAKDKSFNTSLKTSLDPAVGKAAIIPQDLSRVILNIVNNACYAVDEKARKGIQGFSPEVLTSTKKIGSSIEIRIRDNGSGIPEHIREKIFNPFFTTKPTGKGTGLGLSMSFDIVTQIHKGKLEVKSQEGEFTEFIITIPEKQG